MPIIKTNIYVLGRNRAAIVFSIQSWLGESEESKKNSATPGYLNVFLASMRNLMHHYYGTIGSLTDDGSSHVHLGRVLAAVHAAAERQPSGGVMGPRAARAELKSCEHGHRSMHSGAPGIWVASVVGIWWEGGLSCTICVQKQSGMGRNIHL